MAQVSWIDEWDNLKLRRNWEVAGVTSVVLFVVGGVCRWSGDNGRCAVTKYVSRLTKKCHCVWLIFSSIFNGRRISTSSSSSRSSRSSRSATGRILATLKRSIRTAFRAAFLDSFFGFFFYFRCFFFLFFSLEWFISPTAHALLLTWRTDFLHMLIGNRYHSARLFRVAAKGLFSARFQVSGFFLSQIL